MANQGNFTESEKELAELFAITLTKIVETTTNDPSFLYQNIYNMAQVNLCYEDPTKISNLEITILNTFETYSRYSEAESIISQSQYGTFLFSPQCNYSSLKAKSVEAGISFVDYYLCRNKQIFLQQHYHNDIPTWFARVEIVNWSDDIKDLAFIDCALIEECIIVDDIEAYIKTDQKAQWLPIEEFYDLYKQVDDEELTRILNTLKTLQRNE